VPYVREGVPRPSFVTCTPPAMVLSRCQLMNMILALMNVNPSDWADLALSR